jgi:hypothetical protein
MKCCCRSRAGGSKRGLSTLKSSLPEEYWSATGCKICGVVKLCWEDEYMKPWPSVATTTGHAAPVGGALAVAARAGAEGAGVALGAGAAWETAAWVGAA